MLPNSRHAAAAPLAWSSGNEKQNKRLLLRRQRVTGDQRFPPLFFPSAPLFLPLRPPSAPKKRGQKSACAFVWREAALMQKGLVHTHMEEEETVDANTKQDSATVKCGFAIIARYP